MATKEQSLEDWLREQEQYFSPIADDEFEDEDPDGMPLFDPRCIEKFGGPARTTSGGEPNEDEQKSEWSEDEHPRADDGKFGSGGKGAKLSYRVAPGHQMPKNGFEGERGNSLWKPPDDLSGAETVREALKEAGRDGVEYRRGFPRMEPFIARELGEGGRRKSSRIYIEFNNDRSKDFSQADAAYAEKLGWKRKNGKPDAARVARLRTEKELTWHHLEDCNRQKMILVSTVIHNAAHHTGGHSLCASK